MEESLQGLAVDAPPSWEQYLFVVSLVLLSIFSLYKISLELISSKEIATFSGKTRRFVEYLHGTFERVDITLGQIIIALVAVVAYTSNTVVSQWYINDVDSVYIDILSLLTTLVLVVVIYFIIPLMASSFRVSILKSLSPFVRLLVWLLSPTTALIYRFKTLAFNMEKGSSMNNISMDELSDAVEIVSKASTPEDKRILTGMVRFANADVSDIMCHRTDMVALSSKASYEDVLDVVMNSGFSRIPVYEDVLDNIVGILYVRDLIPFIDRDNHDWFSVIRKPYFVSYTRMINELLLKFQKKKIHLAIVVDEYGSTLGIVSMEDILEEIVGEIEDESDIEDPFYSKIDDNTYIFEGKTALSDFISVLELDTELMDEIRGEAETVAGLVVELRQDMPKIGSKARMLDYVLTVVKMDNHRIERVKLARVLEDASKISLSH